MSKLLSKQIKNILSLTFAFLFMSAFVFAQDSVTVTWKVNTAFVPDTVNAGSSVSLRGAKPYFGSAAEWDIRADGKNKLNSVKGDYWIGSFKVKKGMPTGGFKIVTQTGSGTGWDRTFNAGYTVFSDTTISLFTNGLPNDPKYPNWEDNVNWNPLNIAKNGDAEVVAVHFRVNVGGFIGFDPAKDTLYIRGNPINDGWSIVEAGRMMPETNHDDLSDPKYPGSKFYSKTILIPKAKLGQNFAYKFYAVRNGNRSDSDDNWENHMVGNGSDIAGDGNRIFTLNGDTTLFWKYFNNKAPVACPTCADPVTINFTVDLDNTISNNGFDQSKDTLYVRAGFFGTASAVKEVKMDRVGLGGTIYSGSLNITGTLNDTLQYAYFKKFVNRQLANDEKRDFFYDFNDPVLGGNQQNRKVVLTSNNVDVEDSELNKLSSKRQPLFENTAAIAQDTKVILEVDYRPAINEVMNHGAKLNANGSSFLIDDSNIGGFSVYANGPLTRNVDGTDWGSTGWTAISLKDGRKMADDGLNDDAVANDSIWTATFNWKVNDAQDNVSQQFKFGINGLDNEAGYGNNHLLSIKAGQATQRVRSVFGDIYPSRYPHWDFAKNKAITGVVQVGNEMPANYVLGQNYPNPFNPSTVIPFSVPKAGLVRIEIYNMVGQKIMEFSEVVTAAGNYTKTFNGSSLTSGTYLYKIMSGNFVQTKKMMLVK